MAIVIILVHKHNPRQTSEMRRPIGSWYEKCVGSQDGQVAVTEMNERAVNQPYVVISQSNTPKLHCSQRM